MSALDLVRFMALLDDATLDPDPADERLLIVENPASGQILAGVPKAGAAAAVAAIERAAAAFDRWRRTLARERSMILRRWHELLLRHREDLATIITLEQGKPLAESRAEAEYAAAYVEWYAEECKRADGEIPPSPWSDRRLNVLLEPVGVCAAITPWNFPAAMIARKAAPALAAGCTMVIKPSELTPLTARALLHLAMQAGVPAGVMELVVGDAQPIGAVLTSHEFVRKLSFTGSTAVGRRLAAQCATTVKRLSLELGGDAPFIVFDDADVEAAVEGAIAAKFRNAGQACIAANRFLVQAGISQEFSSRFAARALALRVGNGLDDSTHIGPLIHAGAADKVRTLIQNAVASGEVVLQPAHKPQGAAFVLPTLLVKPVSLPKHEEIFGPVAPLRSFQTEAEALMQANDTPFGLAAYVYSGSARCLARMTDGLQVGMVAQNSGVLSSEVVPFGGVKQSGYGREGSRHGLAEYMAMKLVNAPAA